MKVLLFVIVACCLSSLVLARNTVVPVMSPTASRQPIRTSGIDYICRGSDRRPLGQVGAVLQQAFSSPLRGRKRQPKAVKVANQMVAFPPFLAINAPYGGRWATFRIGWRYDRHCEGGRYIADVIVKLREEQPLFY